ncbi:ScbA/BarX family gamma-butyrolactone biosynthesis protein [Rhodococcus phenolicus]|uniref:ScbA/BarX family gamma-butyrolactone biosynthesis protein n=1 Tax=Rhodococcus phenolicus TaxID=263849 RepID=UPI00082EDC9E|nr:ScbA/BarX family gamma-butyrolactone biosynthesis protein [Rhodococcus phenolicus]
MAGGLHVDEARPVLGFESTVPRRFVHRRAVAEVFLTDCVASEAPDDFVLGAQWPRLHGYYRSQTGRYDTMLLVETLRQATIYLAHTRYRVPLGHPFVMHTLRVDATPHALAIGDRPAEVTIEAHVGDQIYRGNILARFSVTYVCSIDGTEIGRGVGTASVFTPAAYAQLRWGGSGPRIIGTPVCPEPIAAEHVGRSRPEDVVLGEEHTPNRWTLRVDDTHPVLFDHPSDHVPGMLVLEAFRQGARAALAQPHGDIETIEVTYHRFAENDANATVSVEPDPDSPCTVRVSVEQWGQHIASGRVRLLPARFRP